MNLVTLLTQKIKESELSATAAAEKAGVAYPSFAAVVNGKSLPNARTFKKYAKFLGLSTEDVQKLVVAAKGAKLTGKPRGRPPGRGPGRPRGSMSGRSSSRRANAAGGVAASLQQAVKVVAQAEAVLADALSVEVHGLGKAQRRIVESVLAGLR